MIIGVDYGKENDECTVFSEKQAKFLMDRQLKYVGRRVARTPDTAVILSTNPEIKPYWFKKYLDSQNEPPVIDNATKPQ